MADFHPQTRGRFWVQTDTLSSAGKHDLGPSLFPRGWDDPDWCAYEDWPYVVLAVIHDTVPAEVGKILPFADSEPATDFRCRFFAVLIAHDVDRLDRSSESAISACLKRVKAEFPVTNTTDDVTLAARQSATMDSEESLTETDTCARYSEKKTKTFTWDMEARHCAEAFMELRKSGTAIPLRQHCVEYAKKHRTKCKGTTLERKLSQYRNRWDENGEFKRARRRPNL